MISLLFTCGAFLLVILLSVVQTLAAIFFYHIAFKENQSLDIVKLNLRIRRLPQAFDGYRIMHISDLHMGRWAWMTLDRMRVLAAHIHTLEPDLIVITGDFVNRGIDPAKTAPLIQALRSLYAPDGVFGILGNHDYDEDVQVVREAVCAGGVRLLVNEHVVLCRADKNLVIAGVDDTIEGVPNLDTALQGIPDDTPVILLAHEPDYADTAAHDGRVKLMLSGHTHGGQMRLPAVGVLYLPDMGREYVKGLFQVKHMTLYVNRGVGSGHPHLRLNCLPEITLISLRSH